MIDVMITEPGNAMAGIVAGNLSGCHHDAKNWRDASTVNPKKETRWSCFNHSKCLYICRVHMPSIYSQYILLVGADDRPLDY